MWNIEEFLFLIKENIRIQGYNGKLPFRFTFLSQLCHFCSRLSGSTGYWRHNYARKYTLVLLLRHAACTCDVDSDVMILHCCNALFSNSGYWYR